MVLTKLFKDIAKIWTKYKWSYINGIRNTILLAFIGTVLGCIIGFVCGILQTIPVSKKDHPIKKAAVYAIRGIVRAYVEIFRGTPMVLQAVFFYYGLSYLTNGALNFTDPWTCSIFVVSINTGAYMAETVRGGILSIDKGQTEGAKAIGMNHVQTMMRVILPQALRNIMPQIGNNLIINIKDTCVLSIIGTVELFFTFKSISGALYTYFEAATVTMIIYFILTFTCSRILRWIENKMDGPANFDLATSDTLAFTSGMTKYNKTTGGTH